MMADIPNLGPQVESAMTACLDAIEASISIGSSKLAGTLVRESHVSTKSTEPNTTISTRFSGVNRRATSKMKKRPIYEQTSFDQAS